MEGSQVSISAYRTTTSEAGAKSRFCKKWIPHPLFNYTQDPQYDYDVAVCKLDRPVQIDQSNAVVVLETVDVVPTAGEELTLLGTGKSAVTVDSYDFFQEYLKTITVPVVEQQTCEATYLEAFSNNMLCAGSESGDACLGDSGAPLIRRIDQGDNTFVDQLVGMVSYGYRPCGTAGFPTVYGRIAPRSDWIEDTICGTGVDELGSSDSSFCAGAAPYDDSCAVDETKVVIGLQPDLNPFETFWELRDSTNTLIEKRGPFVMRGTMSQSNLCLKNGQDYTLTIKDEVTDGPDSGGDAYYVDVAEVRVIEDSGILGGEVIVNFSTPGTAAPTATPITASPTRPPIDVPEQCNGDIMLVHESENSTPLPAGAIEIISRDDVLGRIRVKVNQLFPGSSNIATIYYQYAEDFLSNPCYEEQNLGSGDYFDIDIKCTDGTKIALAELWFADESLSGAAIVPNCCHSTVPANTPVAKYMLEFSCESKCSGATEL